MHLLLYWWITLILVIFINTIIVDTVGVAPQNNLACYLFYGNDNKTKDIEWWEKVAAQGNQSAIKDLFKRRNKLCGFYGVY